MGYVGTAPLSGDYRKLDDVSGSFNGSTTEFDLEVGSVAVTPPRETTMLISVGGILQEPVSAYTVASDKITFTAAPASGADFFGILLGDTMAIGTPSDGTITAAKLASTFLTVISATTTVADADLILIDDAAGGTFRKMTRAHFIESAALDAINIDGGAIDGAVIGANSAAAGTFAALVSTTFAPTDDITLAADKSLNLPQGANIDFTDVIADNGIDDHDAQGVIFTFNAGATVTPFSPVYLAEDNLVEEANASAIATMPCIGVSINTSDVTVGNPIKVLVMGLIRDDDFNFGTHGAAVYVSTTVGTMTSTAPSSTNNVVQVIGHSIEDDAIFVQPCLTTIEHA